MSENGNYSNCSEYVKQERNVFKGALAQILHMLKGILRDYRVMLLVMLLEVKRVSILPTKTKLRLRMNAVIIFRYYLL